MNKSPESFKFLPTPEGQPDGRFMSRYKGRTGPKAIEQAYPHIVEMIVPLGGFGKKLDAMYEWHRVRGILVNAGVAGAMRMAVTTSDGALLIRMWRPSL
jgi:hypothetical protein